MKRGRVMIIDDDMLICKFISGALSEQHETHVFYSAKDALDCLSRGETFDVILCDLMMPVLTGMDFYERLRQAGGRQAERIIFLTGAAFHAGASEFLSRVDNLRLEKPFKLEELCALVNERVPERSARTGERSDV
jgi:CheY-like chemotaxis protein